MRKLIVIRGNSGSGKSSVAIGIRNKVKGAKKIAIIEQDYFRRFILKEREAESDNNIKLIEKIVKITLDMGYDVILEGILYSKRYGEMIKKIKESVDDFHIYYLDIPFEETLKRHSKNGIRRKMF